MTYEIFEANLGTLLIHAQKLNARLARIGAALAEVKITGTKDVPRRGQPNIVDRVLTIEVNTVAPTSPNGWSFVAKIVHTPDGNIINHVPGSGEIPVGYREGATACDHCQTNRFRRDTYIVRRGSETQQVGSSCLEEFLGTNPGMLCAAMELVVNLHGACDAAVKAGAPLDRTVARFPLARYLAYVAELTLAEGRYITSKSGGDGATARRAYFMLFDTVPNSDPALPLPVRPEAEALAEAARAFVLNKFAPQIPDLADPNVDIKAIIMNQFSKQDGLTDFEHNLYTIARSESIERRLCGFAGYIIEFYRKANRVTRTVPQLDAAGLTRIFAMFQTAAAGRLKRPAIRLADENIRLHLTLAGSLSKNAGGIYVKAGSSYDANYYGKITPQGKWLGVRQTPAAVEPLLMAFAANPEEIAKKYGKLTGCCSFCGRRLTDVCSTAAGFGPVCAEKFGLFAEWKRSGQVLVEESNFAVLQST